METDNNKDVQEPQEPKKEELSVAVKTVLSDRRHIIPNETFHFPFPQE